jgi:predicted nucleic acid-binding protein
MYLVDSNIWLELLLKQQAAAEAQAFFERVDTSELAITEFSLYSLGIILTRLGSDDLFADFLADTMQASGVTLVRLDPSDLRQLLEIR